MRRTLWLPVALALVAGCKQDHPKVETRRDDGKMNQTQLARASDAGQGANQVNGDKLQLYAGVYGPMPTGVAVSKERRVFVNFPRWGDDVKATVAEIVNGKAVAYPNEQINYLSESDPANTLVSVQSIVVDEKDRLWIVDTGSINMATLLPGGQKLLCVDLKQNKVIRTIRFKEDVALKTTYLNDVRFDLGRGGDGVGFITDSSDSGHNGIIVVDLASGESWRRLDDHPSTKAEPNFSPSAEGKPLMVREPGKPAGYLKIGSDGIALSADKKTLYYCPLASRHLYSVSADALADREKTDQQVAATVKDLGDRGYASDGLEGGRNGEIYLTDYEHNAIHVRTPDGRDRVLVSDPRMIWPDSMSIADDGFLYFTANQLNRQKKFHDGQDLRKQPYAVFRFPLASGSRMETAWAR